MIAYRVCFPVRSSGSAATWGWSPCTRSSNARASVIQPPPLLAGARLTASHPERRIGNSRGSKLNMRIAERRWFLNRRLEILHMSQISGPIGKWCGILDDAVLGGRQPGDVSCGWWNHGSATGVGQAYPGSEPAHARSEHFRIVVHHNGRCELEVTSSFRVVPQPPHSTGRGFCLTLRRRGINVVANGCTGGGLPASISLTSAG